MPINDTFIEKHNKRRRAVLRRCYEYYSYPELERYLDVNRKYLNYAVRFDDYIPTSDHACAQLGFIKEQQEVDACPQCGVVHLAKCPRRSTSKQPNRTPGGWVNAKDPNRAFTQIKKRAVDEDFMLALADMFEAYRNEQATNK